MFAMALQYTCSYSFVFLCRETSHSRIAADCSQGGPWNSTSWLLAEGNVRTYIKERTDSAEYDDGEDGDNHTKFPS